MKKTFIALAIEGNGEEEDFSADDSATDTDPADPTLTDDSENTDDDSTDDTAGSDDAEEEHPEDAVVELPDVSDLGVDELAKLDEDEAAKKSKELAQQEVTNLAEKAEDLEVVQTALESLKAVIHGRKKDSGAELACLDRMQAKYGLVKSRLAMECISPQADRKIAVEGFIETIKHLVGKVIEAILKIYEYIKSVFKKFFSGNASLKKNISRLHEESVKLEEKRGKELLDLFAAKAVDKTRYCSVMPSTKKALTYGQHFITGQLAGGITVGGNHKAQDFNKTMDRCLTLMGVVNCFVAPTMTDFAKNLRDVVGNVQSNSVNPASITAVHLEQLVLNDSERMVRIEDYVCPDHKYLYVSSDYLGQAYVAAEMNKTRIPADALDCLNFMGDWIYMLGEEKVDFNHLFLPRVDIETLSGITERMMQLNGVVEDLDSSLNKFEANVKHIQEALELAKSKVKDIADTSLDTEELLKQKYYVGVVKAAAAWIKNSSMMFEQTLRYGSDIQRGWVTYMLERYNQDVSYIKSINKAS